MSLIVSEVYDALVEAGTSVEKARAAAAVIPVAERLVTKEELTDQTGMLKEDLGQVKSELKQDISGVRSDLRHDIGDVRSELKQDISGVKSDLRHDIGECEVRIEARPRRCEVRTEAGHRRCEAGHRQARQENCRAQSRGVQLRSSHHRATG